VSQEEMDDPILPRAKGKTQSSYYIYDAKKSPQRNSLPYKTVKIIDKNGKLSRNQN